MSDFRNYITLETALTRRLLKDWRKRSRPIYTQITQLCRDFQWDKARLLVPQLDLGESGVANREYIKYLLLSTAIQGANMVSGHQPSFVGVGSFDTLLNQVVSNVIQYLENAGTTRIQTQALQLIAQDEAEQKVSKAEHKYGNTQIHIAPNSTGAENLNALRNRISDDDVAGDGKAESENNHVTVRYGITTPDVAGIRSYIASLSPFSCKLGDIEIFPASEHSEGTCPVVVRIESPELHAIHAEIEKHGDFKEPNFPEYKPHATLAYVKPGEAQKYKELLKPEGNFKVDSITISHKSGVMETIPFGMRVQKSGEIIQKFNKNHSPKNGRFVTGPQDTMMWVYHPEKGLIEHNVTEYDPTMNIHPQLMSREWNDRSYTTYYESTRGVVHADNKGKVLHFYQGDGESKLPPQEVVEHYKKAYPHYKILDDGLKTKHISPSDIRYGGDVKVARDVSAELRDNHGRWTAGNSPIKGQGWVLPTGEFSPNVTTHAENAEKLGYGRGYQSTFDAGLVRVGHYWSTLAGKNIYTLDANLDLNKPKAKKHILNIVSRLSKESKVVVNSHGVYHWEDGELKQHKLAADTEGRYVTPFVTFDEQGNDQLQLIASLNSSRLATWGFVAEAEMRGITRYVVNEIADARECEFCAIINGTEFEVEDARRKVNEVLQVQDPEDLRTVQPWPKQDKASLAQYDKMKPEDFLLLGLHIPPYHPNCRGVLTKVGSVNTRMEKPAVEPVQQTIPTQIISSPTMQELKIKATEAEVEQWNKYVGLNPVEVLSKLSGQSPQDIMDGLLGNSPIQFKKNGDIFFSSKVENGGIKYTTGATLDPYTGTFYLNYLDFLVGTPKLEEQFLETILAGIGEVAENVGATSTIIAVAAGQAPHFLKLGFAPQPVQWEYLRAETLDAITEGDLAAGFQTIDPNQQQVILHLLQSNDEKAMVVLADLNVFVEGKSLVEWLFSTVEDNFYLDMQDKDVLSKFKGYFS